MTAQELREIFLEFFKSKGHTIIPSASLIPENDPTVIFTTAGMHPLVPYLLGENHPGGKRIVNIQKCIRTDDIDEVGDNIHHTFFEMLGNWSFGDYFKKEAIEWSWEFLTFPEWLNLEKEKLAVSVFAGDDDAPFDEEAYDIWTALGVNKKRIIKLPKKNNWWGPAGENGPCGPDTEMFFWSGKDVAPEEFNPEDIRWVEIWNNVFMQYNKNAEGKYESLKQKNVDTGMGLERTLAVFNGADDNYQTDLFLPIIDEIEKISGKKYAENLKEFRIIADHLKASVFAASDGAVPSNKFRGYIVRRLTRRAIVKAHQLGVDKNFTAQIAEKVFEIYDGVYQFNKENIIRELENEENKFRKTLEKGLREFNKIAVANISGVGAFDLYQTYGFPLELTVEMAKEKKLKIDEKEFQQELQKHQDLSRTASAGMFKGGLADAGEITAKYHTATHLLLAAFREIFGPETYQKGSNINAERLRFDFNYPQKLIPEQIKQVEDLVNQKIQENIPVEMMEMPKEEALKIAKVSFDPAKYGDIVKVYKIGDFSIEICGGPHAKSTGELGHFKITKEEASSAGVRRIKAVLE